MGYVIETKNLTKSYGKKVAVNGLNFKIEPGEIFALLGLNGAGKTTTIKMLLGLTSPSVGQIRYLEKNFLTSKSEMLPKIGCIVENPGFYKNLSAYENLKIITNIVGFHKKDYIEEVLETVGLDAFQNIKYKRLNISQKQKLAIARALLNNPEILILDEPINGLDPISINEIRTLLLRLAKEKGITILISSHVLSEIEKLADRIAVIHDGGIIELISSDKYSKKYRERIIVRTNDIFLTREVLLRYNIESTINNNSELVVLSKSYKIPEMLKILVSENLDVHEIFIKEFTLEEYFIQLINNYLI